MALTDVEIRSAKPRDSIYKLSDAQGLQLWVMPNGSKLWRLAYRFGGKQKPLAIGTYPAVSLFEARKKRDEAKALLASGVDPGQQKKLDKLTKAISTATTFQAVAEEFIDKKIRERKADTTISKNRYYLELAYPFIGTRPVAEIKAAEVLAVLKHLERRGTLETAKRVRATIGAVIRYAIATTRAESDPTTALAGAIVAPHVKHRAAILDPVAFGGLLRAIDSYDGQPTTKAALNLLALLFPRPGELRQACWREFDLRNRIWIIPAARTKMRREHEVPLPRQAVEILESLRLIVGRSELLFPGFGMSGGQGRKVGPKPISENTLNGALRRLGYPKEEMSAHGFRSTASTLLNASRRFSPDAIENALAHQDANAIRRAYNRGNSWDERVVMAQWWADFLDRLKAGSEIVAFLAPPGQS